jgi:hypothetical protein
VAGERRAVPERHRDVVARDDDVANGMKAVGLSLVAAGGVAADLTRTHTLTGLTPGVTYTITARVRLSAAPPGSVLVVLGANHGPAGSRRSSRRRSGATRHSPSRRRLGRAAI